MAHVAPTAAQLKARFPGKFDAVADATISGALARAGREVDTTWAEGDFAEARMLYAAHDMTLNGLGRGTEAQLMGEGVQDFQRIKLGTLDLQRFDRDRNADPNDVLASTSYGRQFKRLLIANCSGPLVTGGLDVNGGQGDAGVGGNVGAPGFWLGW